MIFDTHAHYDDEQFDSDRDTLLSSMRDNGIGCIVNVSSSYDSCIRSTELAHAWPFIYAAVGLHPDEIGGISTEKYGKLCKLYADSKVIAVGEIGLDYYWDTYKHDVQKDWFIRQLKQAKAQNLPVIIHSRDAARDTFDIIREYGSDIPGVMHAFSYSVELAREYIKMGYYIGVGGVVTFKNGKKLKEVVREIPIEHIVLETDAPYLSPQPFRGKRNSSINLHYVAEEIGRLKGLEKEEVIRITEKNAKNLYKIKEQEN